MRPTRTKRTQWYGLIAAACLCAFPGIWLLRRASSSKGAARTCMGPEQAIVERKETHVQQYVERLAEESKIIDSGEEQLDLVFYGDSIVETFRGTDMGQECWRCRGGSAVFYKYFGSRYKAEIFAVGGDQSAHLQWRLLHGQLLVQKPPKVAVLMIGTNDLGAAAECFGYNETLITQAVDQTYTRIRAIVSFLRVHTPATRLIVAGLPPRGVWSPEAGEFVVPNAYTAPTEALNHVLRGLAAGQESVHYLDCGDRLLRDGKIDQDLQGDGLHPTLQGLAVLAACILPAVESILGPGNRPPNFLDSHPLPLRLWIRDQAASGSFWNN